MPLSRLVVKTLSRLALACLLVVADRIMVHRPMSLDRAQGRARRIQPFARGPHRIAARHALAFEHPRRLLRGPRGLAIRVEPGMGEGAGPGEDRGYHGKKGIAGDRGAHWPGQAKPKRDPFKRLPGSGRDVDRRVDQLVREDGSDLSAPRERSSPAWDETPKAARSERQRR